MLTLLQWEVYTLALFKTILKVVLFAIEVEKLSNKAKIVHLISTKVIHRIFSLVTISCLKSSEDNLTKYIDNI